MSQPKSRIEVGSVITCPACKMRLFQFIKPLNHKEKLTMDHVAALRPESLKAAHSLRCPRCSEVYMDNGAVHLVGGWYPYNPKVNY